MMKDCDDSLILFGTYDRPLKLKKDELAHYGTPRHSGRFPYGSGENPYQHDCNFLAYVHKCRAKGATDVAIAKSMNMTTTTMRQEISRASSAKDAYEMQEMDRLKKKGYSVSAIARRFQINESSVRSKLSRIGKEKGKVANETADILKAEVAKKKYIDVGSGTEQLMGIKRGKLDNAIHLLEKEGYVVRKVKVEQLGTGKDTIIKVLCAPGTEWQEVAAHKYDISLVTDVFYDNENKKMRKVEPPVPVDSKRIYIRYREDGGGERDGTIELRRGVDDISLGNAKYAQVRVNVDGSHYMKGVALYRDDIPEGYDIVYNTHKSKGVPPKGTGDNTVFKELKKDPDNPFGATIKPSEKLIRAQRYYKDKDGKEHQSVLNIVSEEGDWDNWHKSLASQMLGKQPPALAKQQLDINRTIYKEELADLKALTNPTVKKKMLEEFADKCDTAATTLKAAALPRQATCVILPFPDIKANEIYAPKLKTGEKVALIRYPHGGIFEIPILTVNNKVKSAKSSIEGALDAVGINAAAAAKLSGADFDGDTAIVIPVDNVNIRSSKEMINFDPQDAYPKVPGMRKMTKLDRNIEMGKITNLINDMTIQGAPFDEVARATKHSMVVIDAYKHELNYKQSEQDFDIKELRKKYQPREHAADGGASTLLSRSTASKDIPQRKIKYPSTMTPEEKARYDLGYIIYQNTGKMKSKRVVDKKTGEVRWDKIPATESASRMSLVDNAYDLVSGGSREATTRIEQVYADYANDMKALALEARRESRNTRDIKRVNGAKELYPNEINSLLAKLNIAKKNAPLERQAQLIANQMYRNRLKASYDDPDDELDEEHRKKLKGQFLDIARARVGAGKQAVDITQKEWDAINAGAISKTVLEDIIANAKPERIKELSAPPQNAKKLSSGKLAQAKRMLAKGYTQAEVADMMDVSVSTLMRSVDPKKGT